MADGVSYETVRQRLSGVPLAFFKEIVEAHLAASGERRFFLSRTMGGTSLFLDATPRRDWNDVDGGALDDLVGYGLLRFRQPGNSPIYTITAEGTAFYRWLMHQEGTPIEQSEELIIRFVKGSDFAQRHPGCSQHLGEALDLLRADRTDEQTVSELGAHLRNAAFDLTSDLIGGGYNREKPVKPLKDAIQQVAVSGREKAVLGALVDLLAAVLRLDQRITHIRDESDKGLPLREWDEVRRAVHTTVFVCAELDRALG